MSRRGKHSPADSQPAPAPEPPPRKRRRGLLMLLLLIGAGAALASNESLRSKLLDLLFGAEEEFEYTSVTEPAAPPQAAVS